MKHSTSKSSLNSLRKQAEDALANGVVQGSSSVNNIKDYIHELQVYQIELEMQADELRKTQLELIGSRDAYAILYDHAPIGYISINFSGIVIKSNQTFSRMLQVDQNVLFHKPLSQFIQKSDHPLFFSICQRASKSAQFRTGEIGFVRSDGSLFFGRLDLTCQEGSPGIEDHYRITVVDVTEKRQAEQEKIRLETQLLKYQKEDSLKRLAGGIAHNFNNLLTIIMGNIELLREGRLSEKQTTHSLRDAYNASTRAAELSTMMLSYLGFPPTRPQSIELSQTIDNILTVLQSTLHGLLHLSFSASSTPIYISGDPTQLAQIINNLIDNSVEAIGTAPGSISVSVYEDHFCQRSTPSSPHGERIKPGRYACIEISDSGCGMDRKTLEKAIDPFFTTHFTGRGLGLSAVWGIVHAHQGYFFLNSEVGRGTVAKIFLPLSQLRDPALPKLLPPLRQAEIVVANKTILFVDDDQIVRKIGKLLLEDEGYHVIEAEGGKEAVALYRHHEKDILCVILDFAMPDQDGSITLNELRAVNPRLPVLLVSGFLKEQTADKFLTEKPNAFLQKPFNRDEFLHAIGEMLMSGG